MIIPQNVTLDECYYLLDGGSMCLMLSSDSGDQFSIKLDNSFTSSTAGKVFSSLKGELPLSETELSSILKLLSKIECGSGENKEFVQEFIQEVDG